MQDDFNFINLYKKQAKQFMRSTFNGNLIDLMSQQRNYQNHRKKIEGIMNKKLNPVDTKRVQTVNAIQSFKVRAVNHSVKQKSSEIMKDNDLIFKKLLKVNLRKNPTFKSLNSSRTFSHKNLTSLKKGQEEITHENNLLAEKLVTVRSHLSQEKLMSNYQKHLQIKERLKKFQVDEDAGVVSKKLKSLEKLRAMRFGETVQGGYCYGGGQSRVSAREGDMWENEEER